MLPTKFQFIWPSGFRGGEFKKNDQSEKRIACGSPCLLTNKDEMCNLYRGPSIAISYKDSTHLAKRFQRKIFYKHDRHMQFLLLIGRFLKNIFL
jgi:hypothetical protein